MIIASNLKTNHTRKSTQEFILHVDKFIKQNSSTVETRVYPTPTALDSFVISDNIKVGAQNFYPIQNGSFTGEIGFEQLEEFDISSVLIGHSERRHILQESPKEVVKKYDFAKDKGVEIIYCIGEPKEVREAGIEEVMRYIWEQFDGIDIEYERLIVAYEPVWAIGTGLSASVGDIADVLKRLNDKIKKPLLYGGSVKTDNLEDVLKIENCSGVLVGTASWQVQEFCKMIKIAQNIMN